METASHHSAPRLRRYTWRMLGALLALLIATTPVFAAQIITGNIVGTGLGQRVRFTNPRTGNVVTDFAGEILLQLDKNTPGDNQGPRVKTFCIEVNVPVNPANPPPYRDGGAIGSCQIRFLLARYFALGAPTNADATATQLAIWHYSDGLVMTTIQDPALQASAAALVIQADAFVAQNGCPNASSTVPSLTIS